MRIDWLFGPLRTPFWSSWESILEHLGGFGHTVWPIGGPREVLGSRCKFLGYLMGYQGGLG